jgi:hypothetical protein
MEVINMKSFNNILEVFVEKHMIENFIDENDVCWYNVDNIKQVIPVNMDWYKHLFTFKTVIEGDNEVRFITKAALIILLQNTETIYGEYLKLLNQHDAIQLKLDALEAELKKYHTFR